MTHPNMKDRALQRKEDEESTHNYVQANTAIKR